jgi:hypothetical protein
MIIALIIFSITNSISIALLLFNLKQNRTIMANQKELAVQLTAVNKELVSVKATVGKVATETTGLVAKVETQTAKIAELEAIILGGGEVAPELQAAFDAVKASSADIAASVKAVDDLVADAPVEETPTEPIV